MDNLHNHWMLPNNTIYFTIHQSKNTKRYHDKLLYNHGTAPHYQITTHNFLTTITWNPCNFNESILAIYGILNTRKIILDKMFSLIHRRRLYGSLLGSINPQPVMGRGIKSNRVLNTTLNGCKQLITYSKFIYNSQTQSGLILRGC